MLSGLLSHLKSAAIRVFFPPRCMLCGRIIQGERYDFCEKCMGALPRTEGKKEFSEGGAESPRYIDLSAAPFYYEGRLRAALLRYKFRGKKGYAGTFARYMYESYRRALSSLEEPEAYAPCYITWIPISKKRLKSRGYDQSRLLAEALGEYFGVPVFEALEKISDNPPQSGLDAAARKGNVLGVYRLKQTSDITLSGKPVLLVDDICTTGATASEAAKTLLLLKPSKISALFIAKTENKYENAKKRLKMTKR